MSPMKESRQNHNIIYLPKRNSVLVCGGQNTKSCEEYNLNQVHFEIESDSYNNGQWISLPTLNQPRANASMFCVNDNYVYCVFMNSVNACNWIDKCQNAYLLF